MEYIANKLGELIFGRKRWYFRTMLRNTQNVIWQKELKRFQLLHGRERIRKQYDNAKSVLEGVNNALKEDPAAKETITRKERLEKAIENFEKALSEADKNIHGVPSSEANPEGEMGIDQQIQEFVNLRDAIKLFIKRNV